MKVEVAELVAVEKLHRELADRVHSHHRHLRVVVAADEHKVVRKQRPDARPHEPDAVHVEMRSLNQLLHAEDTRPELIGELLLRHLNKRLEKVDDGLGVEALALDEEARCNEVLLD